MQTEKLFEGTEIGYAEVNHRPRKISTSYYSLEPQADLIALGPNNIDLANLFVRKTNPDETTLSWQNPNNSIIFQIREGVRIVINRDSFSINDVDYPINDHSNHQILYDYLSRFAASITAEHVRNYLTHVGIPEEYRGIIDWLDNRK